MTKQKCGCGCEALHIGSCTEAVKLYERRRQLWHVIALYGVCLAIYLICTWNNDKDEQWYSEADCGPDCVEVHGE